MRYEQALELAKDNGITVHYINIDKKTVGRMRLEERAQLRSLVESTGGVYGEALELEGVETFVQQIVAKERRRPIEVRSSPFTLGFWLIVGSLCLCSFSRLLETMIMRVL